MIFVSSEPKLLFYFVIIYVYLHLKYIESNFNSRKRFQSISQVSTKHDIKYPLPKNNSIWLVDNIKALFIVPSYLNIVDLFSLFALKNSL